ncbi:MAG: hypothetical protein HKL79_02610 [Thermoplasmata archaeon]|nr:hypothetical protein [Thermoplasmata archaeon]
MSDAGHEHRAVESELTTAETSHASVPWVVLAAVLCGVGIFLIIYWLIYFVWPAFSGVVFVLAGAFLLFNRRTGLDRA